MRLQRVSTPVPEHTFAVFRQESHQDMHAHVGDVRASDHEMALALAKEQFTRREPCVSLWVVRYSDIGASAPEDAAEFAPATDKSYRFGGSYREQQRVYRKKGAR